MAKGRSEYNWSDAWLLLAIIYAGGDATLERIIAAGDGINHAIFNPDEMESGFARLSTGGYIEERAGTFSATDKVMRAYKQTTSPRVAIHKELKEIGDLIGAASLSSGQPRPNDLEYVGFTEAAYTEAVNKYLEGAGAT